MRGTGESWAHVRDTMHRSKHSMCDLRGNYSKPVMLVLCGKMFRRIFTVRIDARSHVEVCCYFGKTYVNVYIRNQVSKASLPA